MPHRVNPEERYSQSATNREIPRSEVEAAISRAGLDPRAAAIRKLSGGFQNANYLVEENSRRSVYRFYAPSTGAAGREAGILEFLNNRPVAAPALLDFFHIQERDVAILEFVEGELLQNLLKDESRATPTLFRNIGAELGRIHAIEFARSGIFGPAMRFELEFENCGNFAREYMEEVLGRVQPERLAPEVRDRLRKLVENEWKLVMETEPLRNLVHCDFNPKNLLIRDGEVAAVLDWEFSLSGSGYIDLGNFFRFAHEDYPEFAEAEFFKGYEIGLGRKAHPRWRDLGRLHDLVSMCSFLDRPEDYPKTFRTARAVIERTLAHFSY